MRGYSADLGYTQANSYALQLHPVAVDVASQPYLLIAPVVIHYLALDDSLLQRHYYHGLLILEMWVTAVTWFYEIILYFPVVVPHR